MEKNCKNCAWYCHANGCCYGTEPRLYAIVPASEVHIPTIACKSWAFDGLEDWERD